MFFVKTLSKQVVNENKGTAAGALKILGERWRTINNEEKAIYIKMSEDDKKRHDQQLEQFKEHGYFILEDGTKSTDEVNIIKLKKRPKPDGDLL